MERFIRSFTAGLLLAAAPFAGFAESVTGSRISVSDANAVLEHHNAERAEVDVPPLAWSPELAGYAQNWADSLKADGCTLRHRSKTPYGENLYMGTAGHYQPVDGSKSWAEEKRHYPGGPLSPANWYPSGHYTQMVWRDTTKVGCGQSLCNGMLILVCNYQPAGNIMGRRPY